VSPSPDAILLNEPQRRHLGIVLGQIQRLLHDIVILTGGAVPRGGLVAEADDLPPAFVRGAGEIITRVDAEISKLAARFDLPQREQSRYRWVRAVLSASIDDLEDTRADRLGAYGAVQPHLAGALDPTLQNLQRELRSLAALLEAKSEPPA
jgi:hypothetical protein